MKKEERIKNRKEYKKCFDDKFPSLEFLKK